MYFMVESSQSSCVELGVFFGRVESSCVMINSPDRR